MSLVIFVTRAGLGFWEVGCFRVRVYRKVLLVLNIQIHSRMNVTIILISVDNYVANYLSTNVRNRKMLEIKIKFALVQLDNK